MKQLADYTTEEMFAVLQARGALKELVAAFPLDAQDAERAAKDPNGPWQTRMRSAIAEWFRTNTDGYPHISISEHSADLGLKLMTGVLWLVPASAPQPSCDNTPDRPRDEPVANG